MTMDRTLVAHRPAETPVDANHDADAVLEGILTVLAVRDTSALADAHATGAWCRRLATALHRSNTSTELAETAGLLHDIGEIAIPETILFKPGPLTDEEWTVVRQHTNAGASILAALPPLAIYAPIVRAHHERWDGRGYPLGLRAEAIPFEARIVAVADAFHALITDRPHRPALAQRDAMEILREGRATQWDAAIVDAMLNLLDAPRTAAGRRYVAQR
jgi:HD-GYP domain-containing protein (c-di-GMP phosphodiesterase class II)